MVVEVGFHSVTDACKSEFPALFEAQAVLLAAVVSSNLKKSKLKVSRLTYKMWKSSADVLDLYVSALQTMKESSFQTIVFGSYLINYLVNDNNTELVKKFKANLLDMFVKVAVSVKVKPPVYVVDESRALLRQLTHDEFKGQLLPAIQKAMLRNPEIILECVGHIISALSLDLSQYAGDIGKSLAANLHSKEDLARVESADACKHLAQQCSDAAAIEQLLNQIFAVFHGSEGKLTVAEQKMSVLQVKSPLTCPFCAFTAWLLAIKLIFFQGAGNLSFNAVGGSSVQKLATFAAEQFIKVLGIEGMFF